MTQVRKLIRNMRHMREREEVVQWLVIAANRLVARYLANDGIPENEFVSCITDDNPGRKMLKAWRELRDALADLESKPTPTPNEAAR